MNESIEDLLGVDNGALEPREVTIPVPYREIEGAGKQIDPQDTLDDFAFARKTIQTMIEKGQEIAEVAIVVAKETDNAKSIEVAANAVEKVVNATEKLIALQERMKKLQEETHPSQTTTIENQNIIVTTSSSIIDKLKKMEQLEREDGLIDIGDE